MLSTVVLMGRFTHDIKIKKLDSGKQVISFCLAVERKRANKNEEKKCDFIDCIAWENTAEFINTYFKKGDAVIVQGRLETRQYEDKQGNKRKTVYVVVNNVNFCAFRREKNKEESKEIDEEKTNGKDLQELLEDGDLPF